MPAFEILCEFGNRPPTGIDAERVREEKKTGPQGGGDRAGGGIQVGGTKTDVLLPVKNADCVFHCPCAQLMTDCP